jgi:hypothetical protein
MKLWHTLLLAGFIGGMTGPLAFAQTNPATSQPEASRPKKPQSQPTAGQYPDGARKQATQGLPPGLAPNTAAPWNNQNQPAATKQ